MIPIVSQPTGDRQGPLALWKLNDNLVLAQLNVRYAVGAPELCPYVVGVQDGHVCHVPEFGAVHPDVVPGPQHLSEVAVEACHATEALLGTNETVRVALLLYRGLGEEGREVIRAGDGAAARSAASMGGGEGLVQVEVHDVYVGFGRAHTAHVRVHVRAVHVEEGVRLVQDGGDLGDVPLVDAAGVGVGDHERRRRIVYHLPQLVNVDAPMLVEPDLLCHEPSHRGCRRVGPVRRRRNEDCGASIVTGIVEELLDHQDAGQLPLRPGERLQGDVR